MMVCLLDSRLRGNDERGAIYVVMYNSVPNDVMKVSGHSWVIIES